MLMPRGWENYRCCRDNSLTESNRL